MILFNNRIAIITGCGAGIGRQYALELAKRGCKIVVNDIEKTNANSVVEEILNLGGKAIANFSDVNNSVEIIDQTMNEFGRLDVIINNAGILRDKSFHKMTKDEWKSVINVHLQGTFEMCHASWPIFQRQNYGRIVNVGSAAGLYGNFGQANYSAAKMGILGLTNTLAKEGEKYNIKVNCVVPVADSKMTQTALPTNILSLLDSTHVSPFVAYLAHESVTTTGGIYEVGGGYYSKVRFQRTQGVCLGKKHEPCSAESIRDNFQLISNFDNNSVFPSHPADTLRDIVNCQSRLKQEPIVAVANTPIKMDNKTNDSQTSDVKFHSENVFESFGRFVKENPNILTKLNSEVNCSVQFHITNQPTIVRKWLVDLKQQSPPANAVKVGSSIIAELVTVEENTIRSDVVVACSDEVFMKLLSKELSPEYAYLSGALKVKGNPLLVEKVKILLSYVAGSKTM